MSVKKQTKGDTYFMIPKKKLRKGLSSLKVVISLLLCTVFAIPVTAYATSISEIEKQIEEVNAKQAELDEELKQLLKDKSDAEQYKDVLEERIDLTEQKINDMIENIKTLNENIDILEEKLEESAKEYEETYALFQERLVSLYVAGEVGTIDVLLSADSLYEFSLKQEALQTISDHDKKLMDKITQYIEKTEDDRKELEDTKVLLANQKIELEESQFELEKLNKENNDLIDEINANKSETEQAIAKLAEEDDALNAELVAAIEAEKKRQEEAAAAAAAAAAAGTGVPPGTNNGNYATEFDAAWPVPGFGTSYITWYFGGGHNGLDIGAPQGTPVVATEDGKVLSASSHYSWGNNVLVYHNGTYSSRYAHLTSFAVSAGEFVAKGQVVGYVGNTGYSFGNHLHFEIYRNGTRVDPYQYLK